MCVGVESNVLNDLAPEFEWVARLLLVQMKESLQRQSVFLKCSRTEISYSFSLGTRYHYHLKRIRYVLWPVNYIAKIRR